MGVVFVGDVTTDIRNGRGKLDLSFGGTDKETLEVFGDGDALHFSCNFALIFSKCSPAFTSRVGED